MSYEKLNSGDMPERPQHLHWVETVDARSKVRFMIFSPQLWQVWTHYSGKTKPCFQNRLMCQGGHKEETMRWYAYLFGYDFNRSRPGFVQLTLGAARMLRQSIAEGVSLKGITVDVSRPGSKQGPLHCSVVQFMNRDSEKMGADCDPHASLFKLWGVNHVGHAMSLKLGDREQDLPDSEKVA
jgi:hypothetical protein